MAVCYFKAVALYTGSVQSSLFLYTAERSYTNIVPALMRSGGRGVDK